MKNIHKIFASVLLVATFATSCKKSLIEINTNPNLLNDAAPEFLLSGATVDLGMGSRGQVSQKYGQTLSWMQYVVPEGASTESLGNMYWRANMVANKGPQLGFSYYGDYYNGIGRDTYRIIQKINAMSAADQEKYKGVAAICKILDTFHAWRLADMYGALPYKQAFDVKKFPRPLYDYNWELYKDFDKKLKEAATVLKGAGSAQISLGNQDFFYAGDYSKWLELANSLRIKIAQRFEKRDPSQLASVLADVAAGFAGKVMSSNNSSFAVNHTRDWNNNVDDINNILFNYNASFTLVEYLKRNNDPRSSLMLRENDFGLNYKTYKKVIELGTPETKAELLLPENQIRYMGKHASPASAGNPAYGVTGGNRYKTFNLTGSNGNQTLGYLSAIQTRLFVKNGGFGGFNSLSSQALMHDDESYINGSSIKMKTYFITYADVCFMMAEIAAKGGNGLGKSAEQWYRAGVSASVQMYKEIGVATGVPLAANVADNGFSTTLPYTGLASIYSQAWVNNMIVPDEAWATWKRTGYPQFTDVRPNNNGQIGQSSVVYLENLWDGSENNTILRRGSLPQSSNLMFDNNTLAIKTQVQKDGNYGTVSQETRGRIWWDRP